MLIEQHSMLYFYSEDSTYSPYANNPFNLIEYALFV